MPRSLFQAAFAAQFSECAKQLAAAIEQDPKLAARFSSEQLAKKAKGEVPDGFVWHHNEREGLMQLVDAVTHEKTGHTGGGAIWGNNSPAAKAVQGAPSTALAVAA